MALAQPGPGARRDAPRCAKAFRKQLSMESCHIPPQILDGPWIVSRVEIGLTQAEMRPGLEADMPERYGQGQGALAVDDGTVYLARQPASGAHLGVHPPEPQLVAQR